MPTNKAKVLLLFAGFLVSGISLWLVFRNAAASEIWAALARPDYKWLLPSLFFGLLAMLQQAHRWGVIVSTVAKVRFMSLLAATSIGFLTNNILPFRLGEFARAYSLARQDKRLSLSSLTATVLLERLVFDLGFLAVICFILLYPVGVPLSHRLKSGALISLTIVAAFLTVAVILAMKPARMAEAVRRCFFFLSGELRTRAVGVVERFGIGLRCIRSVTTVTAVIFQTSMIWLFMALSVYCLYKHGIYEKAHLAI